MPPLDPVVLRLRLRPGRMRRCLTHPVFGVALLLILALALIAHGEPQPSSRPSGLSVVVGPSSSAPVPVALPPTVLIRGDLVERVAGAQVRRIVLPAGVQPVSVLTSDQFTVVLGQIDGYQHAYGVTAALRVTDLGLADGVIASSRAGAAVIIERAVLDPGNVATSAGSQPSPGATSSSAPSASPRSTAAPSHGGTAAHAVTSARPQPSTSAGATVTQQYTARRYNSLGRPVGASIALPDGTQIATDTAVGLVVWKPTSLVVDHGVVTESLSATATLIRPNGSLRVLGPFHPLAATATDLLVWNVGTGQFGLIPLAAATSDSTMVDSISPSASDAVVPSSKPAERESATATSTRPSASASPSTVPAARFFQPTRGLVVTGPASFSPDGSAFAAYAQVGDRRRLVVGQVAAIGTDQIAVLALTEPADAQHSASAGGSHIPVSGTVTAANPAVSRSGSPSVSNASESRSTSAGSPSASASPSASVSPSAGAGPAFSISGFPVLAPTSPLWFAKVVVAVAADGTLIDYVPGGDSASILKIGSLPVTSVALSP